MSTKDTPIIIAGREKVVVDLPLSFRPDAGSHNSDQSFKTIEVTDEKGNVIFTRSTKDGEWRVTIK
jgi:hypothetical protein